MSRENTYAIERPGDTGELRKFRSRAWGEVYGSSEEGSAKTDAFADNDYDATQFIATEGGQIIGSVAYYINQLQLNEDSDLREAMGELAKDNPSLRKSIGREVLSAAHLYENIASRRQVQLDLASHALRTMRSEGVPVITFHTRMDDTRYGLYSDPLSLEEMSEAGIVKVRDGYLPQPFSRPGLIQPASGLEDLSSRQALYLGDVEKTLRFLDQF